jgi:hypothetical protein
VRARFAGAVIASDAAQIVVATAAERLPFAYGALGRAYRASFMLDASLHELTFTARTSIPPRSADIALLMTQIADVQTLTHVRQRTSALLILGTVGEAVAWDLYTNADRNARPSGDSGILVLAGIGNPGDGARAIATLHAMHGATVLVDAETRQLLVLDDGRSPLNNEARFPADGAISFREPAYLGESGIARGNPQDHALDSGLRVLAVETQSAQRGTALISVENFGKTPETLDATQS